MFRKLVRLAQSQRMLIFMCCFVLVGKQVAILFINVLNAAEEPFGTRYPPTPKYREHPRPKPTQNITATAAPASTSTPAPQKPEPPSRLWFFKDGSIFPTPPPEVPNLWHNASFESDRIVDQLMWTFELFSSNGSAHTHSTPPPAFTNYSQPPSSAQKEKLKTILLYQGLDPSSWGADIRPGRALFLRQRCPVNLCRLTGSMSKLERAQLVLFRNSFGSSLSHLVPGQLWMMYQLESPYHSESVKMPSVFNLTASYRHDSDIVTPYQKWAYYNPKVHSQPQTLNYAQGKTSKVAMFVSNCVTSNGRLQYAHALGRYIQVDIYGACGNYSCPRSRDNQCFEMLSKHYKFYLAFENSNCRDYISEKFFRNGLGNNIIPIVMGAHPQDYKRVAPEHSFIHVEDFDGPKKLGEYLKMLDKDDSKYNEYFRWKGTGEFINTFFFCRLCAIAHYFTGVNPGVNGTRFVKDYNQWWRGNGVCTTKLWKNTTDIFAFGE